METEPPRTEGVDSRKLRPGRLLDEETFLKISQAALLAFCFLAPLSIAVSQICIVLMVVYWIAMMLSGALPKTEMTGGASRLASALSLWVAAAVVAALAGVNPSRALPETLRSAFYFFFPFLILAFLELKKRRGQQASAVAELCLMSLISGQALAALHSVFSAAAGTELWPRVTGPLIESGQIVLVFPCIAGLLISGSAASLTLPLPFSGRRIPAAPFFGAVLTLLLLFSWPKLVTSAHPFAVQIASLASLIVLFACSKVDYFSANPGERKHERLEAIIVWVGGTLILCALIINLKRGPWFGVSIALFVIGYCLSRKLLVSVLVMIALSLMLFGPVRARVAQFRDDFSISGGRKNMWELGAEMAQRYPLGIGFDNARYMQVLDPTLPPSHRHMHNNFLNVVVETGWVGLAAYLWWIYEILAIGFRRWRERAPKGDRAAVLALSLTAALLGWQLAGFVEYNFGTGQIRIIALCFMGLLLALAQPVPAEKNRLKDKDSAP